ncbi:MAG: hypothetical protein ACRDNG_02420, partial [Gaiellaceae bacterium]
MPRSLQELLAEAVRLAGRTPRPDRGRSGPSCEPCPMCQATAALVGVSRIVYAAPKEVAAQAGFELRPVAAEMQALLRTAGPLEIEHVSTPGADEPFARFSA